MHSPLLLSIHISAPVSSDEMSPNPVAQWTSKLDDIFLGSDTIRPGCRSSLGSIDILHEKRIFGSRNRDFRRSLGALQPNGTPPEQSCRQREAVAIYALS